MTRNAAALGVLLCLAAGCEDVRATASLSLAGDGGVGVTGRWTYTSSDVDVDLAVTSVRVDAGCATTARLRVDEALESPRVHRLESTPCEELELTAGGDIVLYGEATGHDWSSEKLSVDTDAERILLGPWRAPDGRSHRFVLEAPLCEARRDCECPALTHQAGAERTVMDLGNTCEDVTTPASR